MLAVDIENEIHVVLCHVAALSSGCIHYGMSLFNHLEKKRTKRGKRKKIW